MSVRPVLRLGWMLTRSREFRRSLGLLVLCVALLFSLFIVLNGLALAGPQQADKVLGRFDRSLSAPLGLPGSQPGLTSRLTAGARSAGATDVATQIFSLSVKPDGLDASSLTTGQHAVVSYRELANPGESFPRRYRLLSGRWPTRPGEAAITDGLSTRLPDRNRFSVFSGAAGLTVVGHYRDAFAQDAAGIAAGPGTWESWPTERIRRGFEYADADATLLWTGGAARPMAAALASATSRHGDGRNLLPGMTTRARLVGVEGRPLTVRFPYVYRYPSLLLVGLAALLMVNLNRRRLLAYRGRLSAVGLRAGPVTAAMLFSVIVGAAVATLLGVVFGLGVGSLLKALLLPRLTNQPLSPLPPLPREIGFLILWASLSTAATGMVRLSRPSSTRTVAARPATRLSRIPFTSLRRGLGLVSVLAVALSPMTFRDLAAIGVMSGGVLVACLLFTPDLTRLATRLLPQRRAWGMTARRLATHDQARYGTAATVLACCLALPTALCTMVATSQRTEAANNISVAPPHQLMIASPSGPAAPPAVTALVADAVGGVDPVSLSVLGDGDSDVRFATPGRGAFGVLAVRSVNELARLQNGHLSPAARTALERGGIVDWSGAEGSQRLAVQRGTAAPKYSRALPTAHADVLPSYEYLYAGAVLQETARRLGLPSQPTLDVFTDVSNVAAQRAVRAVTAAGYSSDFVRFHVVPKHVKPPAEWYVALSALALLAFVVLWLVMRSQARNLRTYSARLLAVGLPRRWLARVLLAEAAVVVLTGAVAALLAGGLPIAIFASSTQGVLLDVPVGIITAATALFLVSAAAAAISGLATLRATHTQETW